MTTFELNTDALILKLDSLQAALIGSGQSGDAISIVRSEAKQLSRTITNFVPPLRGDGEAVGAHAVEVGIRAVFSEASPALIDEVGSKHGIRDVHTYVTEKDSSRLALDWQNIDPLGDRIAEYHKRFRDPRTGKTPRALRSVKGTWAARVVVPQGTLQPYIDREKKRVGMWKSSWAFAGAQLGHRFPRWISRHFGILGNLTVYQENLSDRLRPTITLGSRYPGNFRIANDIKTAMKVRAKAVEKRIRLILSNYSQQFNHGTRIRPAAGAVPAEEAQEA